METRTNIAFRDHGKCIAIYGRTEPEALKGKGKTGTLTLYRESV
jgi:hypothetical protein